MSTAVVSACGDDDVDTAEFCEQAKAFVDTGAAFEDPSSPEGIKALERAEDVDAPDEIEDDWTRLIDGVRVLSEQGPEAADTELPPEVQEMGAASSNVFDYINDNCD